MRAACLLTPFFGLLSDNAPIYQGNRNNACSVRTRIWQDVDTDRCGVPPRLMDPDFGFDAYADTVLTARWWCPAKAATARAWAVRPPRRSMAHGWTAARSSTSSRCSSSMPASTAASRSAAQTACRLSLLLAYAQLVRSIFGSQAALQNVLRHYPGVTTVDIANAKLAICKDGFNAWVYGKPIGGELAWLLMQARSRTPSQEERALLDPISRLIAQKKSVREEEADYE